MTIDYEKLMKLKGKEEGERLNLKQTYKWVLEEMSYEDFKKLTTLRFVCHRTNPAYPFQYEYMTDKKHDSKRAREDYLEYYMYKLIQNLMTEGIELQ